LLSPFLVTFSEPQYLQFISFASYSKTIVLLQYLCFAIYFQLSLKYK
jgi:hypothetical protein